MDNALVGRVALPDMDRRRALSVLGLALYAGCTGTRPRATGPRTPPTPGAPATTPEASEPMGVTDLEVQEAEEGHLRVRATVTNRSDRDGTRTLVIRVTVDDRNTERSREVSVPANDGRTVTVDFETIAYDDFSGSGSLQPTLR
jgi:hypothetical protein